MKTLLLAAIAGVFLFSGSAAVSWYLMNQQQLANPELPEETTEEVDPEALSVPPVQNTVEKTEEMPVGLRPDAPITLDAVMQLSKSIRLKEQQLKAEEQRLKKEREGVEMMFADLKLERDQMTAFAEQIDSKLRSLRETVEQTKVESEKLDEKKSSMVGNNEAPADSTEAMAPEMVQRASRIKELIAKMEAAPVADLLKKYANKGELKMAGLVIKGLDQRQATKVLTELSNSEPELAAQLIDVASKLQ